VKLALLGFGHVGRAVAQALLEDRPRARGLRVVAVADRGGVAWDAGGLDLAALLRAKAERGSVLSYADERARRHWSALELLERHGGDVDAVVELTPTNLQDGQPALQHVEAALRAGADVVSANKGPFALHWERVHRLAGQTKGRLRYSATVCGGVPVLELPQGALRGDRLQRIEGVLNGSTNFILSRLERGTELADALAEARKRGLLEEDASLDLLGVDARAKACILANALLGQSLTIHEVQGEGILGVTRQQAEQALRNGMALRLLAKIDPHGASVKVVEIPAHHPLRTEGTENAVRLTFDLAGPITLRGAGAGPRETASAVLSDVLALRQLERSRSLVLAA
jgi:homoserine dehydrogenase